jgi:hypothetical protein
LTALSDVCVCMTERQSCLLIKCHINIHLRARLSRKATTAHQAQLPAVCCGCRHTHPHLPLLHRHMCPPLEHRAEPCCRRQSLRVLWMCQWRRRRRRQLHHKTQKGRPGWWWWSLGGGEGVRIVDLNFLSVTSTTVSLYLYNFTLLCMALSRYTHTHTHTHTHITYLDAFVEA